MWKIFYFMPYRVVLFMHFFINDSHVIEHFLLTTHIYGLN
jgi:hypothetical protein